MLHEDVFHGIDEPLMFKLETVKLPTLAEGAYS